MTFTDYKTQITNTSNVDEAKNILQEVINDPDLLLDQCYELTQLVIDKFGDCY